MSEPKHRAPRKLLVVAECEHWHDGDRVLAPDHFVTELDLWAKMFEQVELHTSFGLGSPSSDARPYTADNIRFVPANGALGPGIAAKLLSLHRVPGVMWRLWKALARCDAVHVRAPCRNALLALLLLLVRRRPGYYKYAALWDQESDHLTWRLQRTLLKRQATQSVVTVYGSHNVVRPHFRNTGTTSLDTEKAETLQRAVRRRQPPPPFRFLWVGRFAAMKDVPTLLRAFAVVACRLDSRLQLVGDGELEEDCRSLVHRLGLEDRVTFSGRLGWPELVQAYGRAHCFVLSSSHREGYPKVFMEAMAADLPCIGTSIGAVGEVLGRGKRGILVPPRNPHRLADAMLRLSKKPDLREKLALCGRKFATECTIECIVDQYREWLEEAWGCRLPSPLEE